MDENLFFRNATLRICGNLEIGEALFSSFQFLREVMPVDMIFLQFFEEDQRAFHTVATANEKEGRVVDMLVPLSSEALQEMMQYVTEFLKNYKPNHVWIFENDPRKQSFTREIYDFHGEKITSLMVMPLEAVKDKLVGGGSLWLSTQGDNRFRQKHAELLSLLKDPFALAMSNALKHRSELKLHEREFFWEATMRICGSLEIERAMASCLKLLQQYMPAARIFMQRFEPSLGAIRMMAQATPEEGKKVNHLYPLSKETVEYVHQLISNPKIFEEVMVVDDPQSNPVSREMLRSMKIKATSILTMPLKSEDTLLGTMVLISDGKEKLTETHANLFYMLRKPFAIAVSNTLKHGEVVKVKDVLADDIKYLHEELWRLSGDEIIGANFGLKKVTEMVRQVASSDSPVLLLGETGTGKDVIANTIHYSSARREGPFISVNCGAIPESLIDSELFGHEKGAFTGALSQKRGRFERADNGTIFLDEVGELPPNIQVRLLRVLQNKEIERVGGIKTIALDIRVIAATNKNLEAMVKADKFREDLWFRLNVFPIKIPPLRRRKSDIPALLQHFIALKVRELKLHSIPELAPGAMEVLMNYPWPGNVRELENVVERALILNPQGSLSFEHLNLSIKENGAIPEEKMTTEKLDEIISHHIKLILKRTKGKIHGPGGAADRLGINPSTLRARMNKLGIQYGRGGKTYKKDKEYDPI